MNKTRLDRIEQKLGWHCAPVSLVALLRELKAEADDTTPTHATMSLAEALAGIIDLLPN